MLNDSAKINAIMLNAIRCAKSKMGMSGPNPMVCAIATDAHWQIIEIATTSPNGRPHAEQNLIEALKKKNIKPLGKLKLFVTLEPCVHYGQTPPCTKAIIESGFFDKIFVSSFDKDERMMGRGIAAIKSANILIENGIMQECTTNLLYKEYFFARQNQRPFVTLKIASSLDGKIATASGESKWISHEETRLYTNFSRSFYDGILIGSGTYLKDEPKLDCRVNGLADFSPTKFVLSSSLQEVKNGFTLIKGDITTALRQIYLKGVNSLLIEGGSAVWTSFIKSNFVDRVIIIKSPLFIGGKGLSSIGDVNIDSLIVARKFNLLSTHQIKDDILLEYKKLKE